jgi:ATP-binding cassette subfamily B protein
LDYTAEEGAIFIMINANEIDLTELRQQLGFVTQDAQLFSSAH